MDRRELLLGLAALSVGAYAVPARAAGGHVSSFGALRPTSTLRGKTFYQEFAPMKGLYKKNKNVFLWKNLQEEIGEIVPHYQGPAANGAQGEGDCVAQAGAMGCDVLAATDIHLRDEAEKFVAKSSVEMLYAGGRIEIGQLARPDDNPNQVNYLRGRGGSHGEWMAQFLTQFGVLHRLEYDNPDGSRLDLTGYHPSRSRKYRDAGVPDWLEPTARKHPVKVVTNPRSGIEALDAVCAGNPVIICSSYAFRPTRDAAGFCTAYGVEQSGRWGRSSRKQWWHAMLLSGALLGGGRVGGLIQNSHGDWNTGPQPHSIPRGSFFVDLATLHLMVTDWYDCWALASYEGHEAKRIRKRIHKLWR